MTLELQGWEKKILPLSLVTTEGEADQILERNLALKRALEKRENYSGRIGCPHCKAVKSCEGCDGCGWWLVGQEDWYCLRFKWGEFTANDVGDVIVYKTHEETVQINGLTDHDDFLKPALSVLNAHILWAERMIDGTYKAYAEENIKQGGEA